MDWNRGYDGKDEPFVFIRRHRKKRGLIWNGIAGVEHFDDDKHSETQSHGLRLSDCEIVARISSQIKAYVIVDFEVQPFFALGPVGELFPSDQAVTVQMLEE